MIQHWGEKSGGTPTRADVLVEWAAIAVAVPWVVTQVLFLAGAVAGAMR